MAEKQINPKPFFLLGIIVVVAGGGWFILSGGSANQNHYEFAACITDAGATMYGFDACPHCNKQKAIIGDDAFKKNITDAGYYIKCRPQSEAQQELGDRSNRISSVEPLSPGTTQGEACQINVGAGTPTWVINGEKYVGEQTLADLAAYTGCELPEGYTARDDVGGFTPDGDQ